jgi:hypothetical protein
VSLSAHSHVPAKRQRQKADTQSLLFSYDPFFYPYQHFLHFSEHEKRVMAHHLISFCLCVPTIIKKTANCRYDDEHSENGNTTNNQNVKQPI